MWFELGVGIDVLCHLVLGTWAASVDSSLSGVVPAVCSDVCVWLCWTACCSVALLSLTYMYLICVIQRKMNLFLYSSILGSLRSCMTNLRVSHVGKIKRRKSLMQQ